MVAKDVVRPIPDARQVPRCRANALLSLVPRHTRIRLPARIHNLTGFVYRVCSRHGGGLRCGWGLLGRWARITSQKT